jgi:hypothetical protein
MNLPVPAAVTASAVEAAATVEATTTYCSAANRAAAESSVRCTARN